MDFVHDQLATGRKLRVITIVDTFSRSQEERTLVPSSRELGQSRVFPARVAAEHFRR
jgi:hypothetical protein